MSESMHGRSGQGRFSPVEWYENTVVPELFARLDQAFPEFGFKRVGKGWEATLSPDRLAFRADRIMCLDRTPEWIAVVDGKGMHWVTYVMGVDRHPKGPEFIEAIRRLAQLAGVDIEPLDNKKMTPAQMEQLEKDQREAKERSHARKLEYEKQKMQDDAKAITEAQALVGKAMNHGDRSPAVGYFTRRGRSMDAMPGGELPSIIRYTPDIGFKNQMIGAVIAPVFKTTGVVGCQRIFIDAKGKPIEIKINGNVVRKAALGRCAGGACIIGDPKPGEPIVLCEGVETGVAIHQLTGWCVMACISAHGMEVVELDLVRSLLEVSQSVLIVAGDLDRSKIKDGVERGMRGQRAMSTTADRLRFELKVMVGESIPLHQIVPHLIGTDELPTESKSVDWEDVINSEPERALVRFNNLARYSTTKLTNPAAYEEVVDESEIYEPDIDDLADLELDEESQKPKDNRKWLPYAPVYPKNQLDAAHQYALAHHGPATVNRSGGGLHIVCFSDRIHIYKNGYWIELEGKPIEVIRGKVRRHFRKHCKAVATKETPPQFHYTDANLSKSEIDSITSAVIDEIRIVQPVDDFAVQFWLRPNVEAGAEKDSLEVIEDDFAWGRVVGDPAEFELPPTDQIIPTKGGIFDIQQWRSQTQLCVMPNTPLLFNLGRIEVEIPIKDAIEAMKENDGGLTGLEEFAWELCPDWKKFLEQTFKHTDEECAPAVMRELHKWMGNLIAGNMGYQKGSIAWFIGPPGTGKSVLLGVVEALLGKNNVVSSTMKKLIDQFHMRSWIGKYLAVFPDMEIGREDKRQIIEQLKMISGGDPVAIDRKYLNEIPNFRLGTRMAIASNQMPGIPDPTLALVRRSVAFYLRHTVKVEDQDEQLVARLTSPESLAGITLLSLIGIKNMDADGGLIQPKWYASLIEDLKSQSSEYAELIGEYLEVVHEEHDVGDDDRAWVSQLDMYNLFTKVCEANGQKHIPRLHTVISQLKICLTGEGWADHDPIIKNDEKGYGGLRITDRGARLLDKHEGAEAGGHESFIPVA